MNFKKIGGYKFSTDLLNPGDTILFACNNREKEICYSNELKQYNIIHICPLFQSCERDNLTRIQRVMTPAFENNKKAWITENFVTTSKNFNLNKKAKNISLTTIPMTSMRLYSKIELIILNLYGEEYKICKSLDGPKQIVVRFYQYWINETERTTNKRIECLIKKKYRLVSKKDEPEFGFIECAFTKN